MSLRANATTWGAFLLLVLAVSLTRVNNLTFSLSGEAFGRVLGGERAATVSKAEVSSSEPVMPPAPVQSLVAPTPTGTAPAITPTRTPATATPTPARTLPTLAPTPAPATNPAPKRIALQAGHWKYKEAPAPLNSQTGTSGGGKQEWEVNLTIATEAARILRSWGHSVDILPAVIPDGLKADLVVAVHADGNNSPNPRGFFTDRPLGSPVAATEQRLSAAIDEEYARATGIPYVKRSTPGSQSYYGYRQVPPSVPMILIETGFLTNPLDQVILVKQPGKAAEGIANGIRKFLEQ